MGSVKIVPTGSVQQRGLESSYGEYLNRFVGSAAQPYTGQLTADIPGGFTQAYNSLTQNIGRDSSSINQALMLDVKGQPAYQSNFGEFSNQFRNEFATPMMEMWKQTVEPLVRGGYAGVKGGLYSAARGRGIENSANQYYAENIQPQFMNAWQQDINRQFQSGEAAAGRRLGAVGAMGGYEDMLMSAGERMRSAQQQGLTANYGEFLRTRPEASPWNNIMQSYLQIPTNSVIAKQGSSGGGIMGALGGAMSGGTMGYLGAAALGVANPLAFGAMMAAGGGLSGY